MKIRLAYGKNGLEIRLPDELNPAVVEPAYVPGLTEQAHSVRDALRQVDSPKRLLETIRTPGFSSQDMWQVQIQALISQKADVYLYSENLRDEQVVAALLKPCRSIETTVTELVQRLGWAPSVCVLPEGPQAIPYICQTPT